MLKQFLLVSLAAAGFVNAQRLPEICGEDEVTVNSDSDLLELKDCKTFSGNLILGRNLVIANLNGIGSIKGNLIAGGLTDLQQIIAPELNSIEGLFNLTSLTKVSVLRFPALTRVGELYWQTLPALQRIEFGSVLSTADSITIKDTLLESLEGINLKTVQRFDINNNRYLKEIKVQLTNVTDSLAIEFNGATLDASFPNLTWANNATFRSVGAISLPALTTVNGSIGFYDNAITTFAAPKLTEVGSGTGGGDITFANNEELKNASFPQLTTVYGTLQFVNNTELENINGFPKLSSVIGSIDVSGAFSNASFPSIKDVRGGLNVQTTEEFDCSEIEELRGNVVKGDSFFCSGKLENPGTEGTEQNGGNGGNNSDNGNAAGRVSVANSFAAIPALALFAAIFL